MTRIQRAILASWVIVFGGIAAAEAQVSEFAIRFYGTGVGPPGQQDRIKIRIDAPASVLDVGDDFTIDFWMRCDAAQNNGTVSDTYNGDGWITGNTIVDRDIYGPADYGDYGISIGATGAARVLAFGLASTNGGRTIVGTNNVGDNVWHHVAVTRVRSNGLMRIYVDGRLDAEGIGPTGFIGYRDGRPTDWPNSDPYLVLAAEKHDAGAAYPSYNGFLDEFRVWTTALTQAQISNVYREVVATNTPGLIAYYRFEEGSGTNVFDSTGQSPVGQLIAGIISNGQWMARSVNTNWTAPLGPPAPPPPSTNITIESIPPGLSITLNGAAETTPFTRSLPITNLVDLVAPTNQTLNGTTYVFRCWSDAGPQNRWLLVPTNGLTLRAGYAPVPGGAIDQPVPSADRNLESYGGTNRSENLYVPNCLCAGRDDSSPLRYEPAMAFPLNIPPGATIQSATLRLRGNDDSSGSPQLVIRAYAVSNIAPFATGAGASVTGLYPLTTASILWTPPHFSNNVEYGSPDISSLVQEVVNVPGWSAGNFMGLVLTAINGSGDLWRCWSNFQSGTPPRLLVTYSTGGAAQTDIDGDGMPDDWEAAYGLDCTSPAPSNEDTDGDGVPDFAEYVAASNPTNPLNFHAMEIQRVSTSMLWKIFFPSATGRVYQLEATTNLLAQDWQPVVTNWLGTGALLEWFDTNSAPVRHYRSGVSLAP